MLIFMLSLVYFLVNTLQSVALLSLRLRAVYPSLFRYTPFGGSPEHAFAENPDY